MKPPSRPLGELIDRTEPAMPLLIEWAAQSTTPIEILPVDPEAGARNLLVLQVTTRSLLGAVAYETGGILVDHGWLRILGAGSPRFRRSIAVWNRLDATQHRLPQALLVGDDAIGGFFAINGGALPGTVGNVHYLAPSMLEWEDLELGHSAWLQWALRDLSGFYAEERWPDWEVDVRALETDQCMSIYPPLWAKSGEIREPISARSRKAVPIEEMWGLNAVEFPRQLGLAVYGNE